MDRMILKFYKNKQFLREILILGLIVYCFVNFYTTKKLQNQVETLNKSYKQSLIDIDYQNTVVENLSTNIASLNEKYNIIDTALSSKDKRFARIKQIRGLLISSPFTPEEAITYASSVVDYSEQYGVPIALILSITKNESAFNYKIVSHAGAQGLMQVMPETAEECARDVKRGTYNIFNIRDNVQLGTWYLLKMLHIFKGDIGLAVRAYNAGPIYVKKVLAGEVGYENFPRETIKYHDNVVEDLQYFRNMGL